jgi:chemotaxis protein MotB
MNDLDTLPDEQRQHPVPPSWRGLSDGFFPAGDTGSPLGKHTFLGEEDTFRSSQPRISHWSIAWSDLMMTMFVLFLSLFVYQAAHREFLVSDEIEVIGGETADALEITAATSATLPFVPIKPAAPLITAGTVRKVEPIRLAELDSDLAFFDDQARGGRKRVEAHLSAGRQEEALRVISDDTITAAAPSLPSQPDEPSRQPVLPGDISPDVSAKQTEQHDFVPDFTVGKALLEQLDLDQFASINLVPDHAMRIILTGDLLFATGRAELSTTAIGSLRKIATLIKDSPYMINVVGHTDNVPMQSPRYETNWELSVARASRVTRFLIEEMGMNPQQFVVSGYGAQRPLHPNADSGRRAANRRVEIIVSRRLPEPLAVSVANHLQPARNSDEI